MLSNVAAKWSKFTVKTIKVFKIITNKKTLFSKNCLNIRAFTVLIKKY